MVGFFEEERTLLAEVQPYRLIGRISRIVGLALQAEGFRAPVGSLCCIHATRKQDSIEAEVVGFTDGAAILMPYGDARGLMRGDRIELIAQRQEVQVGPQLLGRILDGRGKPMDGLGPLGCQARWPIWNKPLPPLSRPRIDEPLSVGIRVLDGMLSCGKGQRLGLFSGSGVGKSCLMGMIARNTNADITVIGLVGERGRELKEFIDQSLGEDGLARSVVVCATSDQPALLRVKAGFTATAVAEYFRSQGKDVLLLMDSITRMAFAQREIGLSIGEPPATKGYPPSIFSMMPKLLERAGRDEHGSITAIYTVLVEGDDLADPIADTARSILDGHIWLSRKLADRGHYPAIDPLTSVSRLAIEVTDRNQQKLVLRLKRLLAAYQEAEDLINIGAYVAGSNPEIDEALSKREAIEEFLCQEIYEQVSWGETLVKLSALFPEMPVPEAIAT